MKASRFLEELPSLPEPHYEKWTIEAEVAPRLGR